MVSDDEETLCAAAVAVAVVSVVSVQKNSVQRKNVNIKRSIKLALLAFNARSNNAPLYLSCLLHNYVPGRSLRSSQSNLLCVPSYKLNFGARSFRVAAPTVWNSLPAHIRACAFYGSFSRQLKTFYFNKNLCGRDGRTICGPQRVPKSTCVSL